MKYKVELTLNEIRILRTHLEITLTLCDGGKKRIYNLYKKLNVFEEGLKK